MFDRKFQVLEAMQRKSDPEKLWNGTESILENYYSAHTDFIAIKPLS